MLTAGTYSGATIRTAQVQEIGEKKTLTFVITFELPTKETINWLGWMSEKAYPYTLDELAKLGFNEEKSPLKDAEGLAYFDASFFSVKEVELVIEEASDLKDPNKKWPRIKWINIPKSAKFQGAPKRGQLPADFKTQLQQAKARTGNKGTVESAPF